MFLPLTKEEFDASGMSQADFIFVTGDAYVDHPSFGTAILSRVLEAEGYSVAIIAQPDYKSTADFKRFGKPRLGFLVNSGNIDSMVAHYTASGKPRSEDYYSPGGIKGKRPDRAVIVYCNRIREAYGDVPIIIGGIEASTRRFAHYDYWTNKVRRSILIDSTADILAFGMGENILKRIAFLLDKGVPVKKIRDVRGTCITAEKEFVPKYDYVRTFDYDRLKEDKKAYATAFRIQYENQDHITGKAIIEEYDKCILVQNPPMPPLTRKELDDVYSLPYMRDYHPSYEKDGGVPAIKEVKFSLAHNRGCFGGCNFCAITFNQGRTVTSRSIESVVKEAEIIAQMPDFKGYIHDVGGPTANFRNPSCEKQKKNGMCIKKRCLFPTPCKNLNSDHSDYIELLNRIKAIKGVKKVFVRSGVRYDFALCEKNDKFLKQLISEHTSGQLKVAPEHCSDNVLKYMGKPSFDVYKKFSEKFYKISENYGKEQYLVPYLMSSHPGSTLDDAIELALYLKRNKINPEQVQDFYPTPGTASTCMFYTELDPFTMKEVYVPKTFEEKKMQRALLQFSKKENFETVRKALLKAGREDLIGSGEDCLIWYRQPSTNKSKAQATKSVSNQNSGNSKKAHQKDYQQKNSFSKGSKKESTKSNFKKADFSKGKQNQKTNKQTKKRK
jgi:uncharacterized radical SAM protein YgiQ